ncbi:LytTR family transcriptional regulator DNA-binding domain-containing protein [Macrococcus sp. DPC7161]|uniref:LytTR family transcriptional regulator DNA-binding domain-containing protein n=1 Tax=Macrococcus sp. DPC7161 TaxID=2507060 RepID=UPI00100B6CAC|nr:LytTR family transcriptional regulator DNA-binding domain-containing protein [Macrococcus sp. DPC7161]RXK18418.1 DNA-binding response regulator [Macrococcus sp. DPC7161]
MNILITDDEPLARNELSYLLNEMDAVENVDEADSIESTFEQLLQHQYDLLFLDIHLMNESGLTLAEKINKMKQPPLIVFATAYDMYAVKAFELNAIDYVLKPFEASRIEQTVVKAQNLLKDKSEVIAPVMKVENISIQVDDKIYVLNVKDIIAVSVEQGHLMINTIKGDYLINDTLATFQKKLPETLFLKIHRGSIINKEHIISAEPWFNHTFQVKLTKDIKLQVSRSYIKDFKSQIGLK